MAKQRHAAGNIDKGEGGNRVRHERRDGITLGQGHQMNIDDLAMDKGDQSGGTAQLLK